MGLLAGLPDGRLAPLPVPPASSYVYLALMVGIVPASVVCLVFAAFGRNMRAVAWSMVTLVVGFFAPVVVLLALGVFVAEPSGGVIGFLTLFVSAGLGFVLYASIAPVVLGHEVLDGKTVPLNKLILPAFVLIFLAPSQVVFLLRTPVLALLSLVLP